jgi:hypothetical protein
MIIISTLTRFEGEICSIVTGYEEFVLFHERPSSSLNITFKKFRTCALLKFSASLYKYCDIIIQSLPIAL